MLKVSTTASNGAHLKERLPVIADADKWDRIETHEPNSWGKFLEASSVKIAMKIYVVVAGPSQMHRCDELFDAAIPELTKGTAFSKNMLLLFSGKTTDL